MSNTLKLDCTNELRPYEFKRQWKVEGISSLTRQDGWRHAQMKNYFDWYLCYFVEQLSRPSKFVTCQVCENKNLQPDCNSFSIYSSRVKQCL